MLEQCISLHPDAERVVEGAAAHYGWRHPPGSPLPLRRLRPVGISNRSGQHGTTGSAHHLGLTTQWSGRAKR
jgi:hypothetical protein